MSTPPEARGSEVLKELFAELGATVGQEAPRTPRKLDPTIDPSCLDFQAAGEMLDAAPDLHELLSGGKKPLKLPEERVGRATIEIGASDRHLDRVVSESLEALGRENERLIDDGEIDGALFWFGSDIARVDVRSTGERAVTILNEHSLSLHLDRTVNYFRRDKDGLMSLVGPPRRVVNSALSCTPPLPPLRGLTRVPLFAPDGSLETTPGYSRATACLYLPACELPPLPERPSAADVDAANRLLDEMLQDFPFPETASKTNYIGLLLTPFLRAMVLGPTPFHLVMKPTSGSGATLLIDLLAIIATGRAIDPISRPRSDDAFEAKLLASLMSGDVLLVLDNLKGELDSDVLEAMLTADSYSGRKLYTHQKVSIPVRVTWAATANNLTLSRDMARRTVPIRLDANSERPEERDDFKILDLKLWALENRARLIWALIVMIRHWIALGAQPSNDVFGSFERWACTVGGVLGACGRTGFLVNRRSILEKSSDKDATFKGFVEQWWGSQGDGVVTTSDLVDLATAIEYRPLLDEMGVKDERMDRFHQSFGILLRGYIDQVFSFDDADIKLTRLSVTKGVRRWKLSVIRRRVGNG